MLIMTSLGSFSMFFSENFTSVVHDITFRTILLLVITINFDVRVTEVEVAFLHDNLTGDIYIVLPLRYHLQKKNEIALHNLGYTGPIKQTSKKFNIKLQKKPGKVQAKCQSKEKRLICKFIQISFVKGQVHLCLIYCHNNTNHQELIPIITVCKKQS